ncbi:MAG: T9SS type A sorting domain-containing protein [Bacteroidota bacterium]
MNKLVSKNLLTLFELQLPIFFFLLCCSFLSTPTLQGQNLNDNGNVHIITVNGAQINLGSPQDFRIPDNTSSNSISFFMRGGSGGSANAGANCSSGGGDGAKVWLTAEIGMGAGELRPGGYLRFVIGKAGANRYSGGTNGSGAGGGGGTGLLYRPNSNADWIVLAVAGGGGGAYQGNFFGGCVNSQKGQGGRETTRGGDGGSNNSGGGGSNGGNGGDGNGSTPGGGGSGTIACYPTGCGTDNGGDRTGGYGYGAGGYGNTNGGGGGGGYSGGGGASAYENGGGGGSYINLAYQVFGEKEAAGADEPNADGFVEYTFGNQCLATVDAIIETTSLCDQFAGEADVEIQATLTNACTNGIIYEVSGPFLLEQNTTGRFSLPLGNYQLRLYTPDNTEDPFYFDLFAVEPDDAFPPVAKCKDYVYKLRNSIDILPSSFYLNIEDGSTDNCGIVSYSTSISQLSCSNIDNPIEVTLTVTDVVGRTATCESTVSVIEGKPTARCKNATYTLTSGEPTTIDVASLIDDGSSTPCGTAVPLSTSMTTFDCNNIGRNTITLTATGLDGGSDDCTARLTIIDGTAPVLDQNTIPVLTSSCALDVSTTLTATDACDGTILPTTEDPTSFTETGTYTITWLFEDSDGNSITQNQTVVVEDTEAPIADCTPGSNGSLNAVLETAVNVGLGPTNFTQQIIDLVTSGSTDNCSIVSRTVAPSIIDCSDIGTTKVITFTVADATGNTSSCTITYTNIVDTEAPEALCQDITVPLDSGGEVSITADAIDAGSSDLCGDVTLSIDQSNFDCGNVSENTVTLTVVDDANNSSSCTAKVTIEDTTPPVISCDPANGQTNIVVDVPINIGNIGYTEWDEGGIAFQTERSTDNCGIVNGMVSPNFIDCSDIGTSKIFTFTLTDAAGNASSCTATYTNIIDETPPEALCRDITVALDPSGNAAVSPTDIDNGSSDICGISSITLDQTDFSCDDVGDHVVTLTVTDLSNNTSECQATVTVEDDAAPIAKCDFGGDVPNAIVDGFILIGITGFTELGEEYLDALTASSRDNCGITSSSITPNFIDCSDIGTTKLLTVTLSDAAGNTSNCTITYTNIVDSNFPKARCQDITIQLDAEGVASIGVADIDNGSTDACGIASISLDQYDFDCMDIGTNMVTMTVEDNYDNRNTCTSTVTVEDNTNPTALCQDLSIQLDGDGNASISAAEIDNGSSDVCGIASITLDQTDFSCDDVGDHIVTLTVTDISNNTADCQATVTVKDTEGPVASCHPTLAQGDFISPVTINIGGFGGFPFDQQIIDNLTSNSTDNCGIVSRTASKSFVDCSDIGTSTIITITFTDQAGNTSSCIVSYPNLVDNTAPEALCKDVTIQLDANGEATTTVSDIDNGSFDYCNIASQSLSQTDFDCSHVGDNTVTMTVVDDYNNSSTCTSTVTVEDSVAPIALCKNATRRLNANGRKNINVSHIDNGSSDACGIASMEVSPRTFFCEDIGDNTVTLTVTDVNGNSSSCTATVTISDNRDPIMSCQDATVYLNANGEVTLTSAQVDAGSTDNCAIDQLSLSQTTFDCSHIGAPVAVEMTGTDASGNAASCEANITVLDEVMPVAVCQDATVTLDSDGNGTLAAQELNGGSTDNCAIANYSTTQTAFDCSDVGNFNQSLMVTDVNGNSSTCTATVTVVEEIAPIASCRNISRMLNANGMASINASDVDNGSSDNCGVASTVLDISQFSCEDIGSNTVSLTVTDESGNSSSCTATVTISDRRDPIMVCEDVTIYLDGDGAATLSSGQVDGGSTDNCAIEQLSLTQTIFDCSHIGGNTVTLTGTDASGNSASCDATVMVMDEMMPVAICQNATISLDIDGNGSLTAEALDGGSTDNCAIASYGTTQTDFDCGDVGSFDQVLSVTDVNGNSSTCTATVTVLDEIAPTAVCKDLMVSFNGELSIAIDIDELFDFSASTDNCSAVNIVEPANGVTIDCAEVGNDVSLMVTVEDANGNTAMCLSNIIVEGLPCGWEDQGGIGCAGNSNSSSYDANTESHTLTASNCTPESPYIEDDMAMVAHELCGDGYIKAYIESVDGAGFAGIILRDGMAAGAKKVALSTNRVNRILKEIRVVENYPAWPQPVTSYDKYWLKIERIGNTFRASASVDDQFYTPYIFQTVIMGDCLEAGIFVSGEKSGTATTAIFSQVEVVTTGGTAIQQAVNNDLIQAAPIAPEKSFSIYPNPATEMVNIDLHHYTDEEVHISILNVSGQVVQQLRIGQPEQAVQALDISNLEAGVYYLHLRVGDSVQTEKLLVHRL